MKHISIPSFGAPSVLQVLEAPKPQYTSDEVLIKVAFIGVGGIDAIMRRGGLGKVNPQPPFIPGLEVSGEIMAVGGNVRGLRVGDKVAALLLLKMGGYAEVVSCKASSVVKIPPEIELADAASLINPTTALVALEMARLQHDETLVVHGAAGGLGGAIGQIVKAVHPDVTTVGVVRSQGAQQFVEQMGYDKVLTNEEFAASVKAGVQYEMVLDPVGGDLRRMSLSALAPRGRMVLLGNASGDALSDISSQAIWLKGLTLQGLNLGYLNSIDPDTVRLAAQQVIKLAVGAKIDLSPTKIFAFSEAIRAHEYLQSEKHYGRIVLSVKQAKLT